MKLSASQAAKEVGKSIPTITRAIKSGKLSGIKARDGGYEIEASELFRVWPAVTDERGNNSNILGDETPKDVSVLEVEVTALREKVEYIEEAYDRDRKNLERQLDELRREKSEQLSDLRKERDDWKAQATGLLEDKRQKERSNVYSGRFSRAWAALWNRT